MTATKSSRWEDIATLQSAISQDEYEPEIHIVSSLTAAIDGFIDDRTDGAEVADDESRDAFKALATLLHAEAVKLEGAAEGR